MVNSKNKGNSGEREAAKIFTEVFGGSWVRVMSSGAYVGGQNAVRKQTLSESQVRNHKGDVTPPDTMSKIVLEIKSYKDFRFHQLLAPGSCPQLDLWISQTLECVDPDDIWFVCFKISRIGWFIAAPAEKNYVFGNHCVYTGAQASVRVTDLKNFLTANRDVIMKEAA